MTRSDPEKVIADLGLTGYAADVYRLCMKRPAMTVGEMAKLAVVMREPTIDMVVAGDEAIIAALNEHPQDPQMKNGTPAEKCWRAMVEAAFAASR